MRWEVERRLKHYVASAVRERRLSLETAKQAGGPVAKALPCSIRLYSLVLRPSGEAEQESMTKPSHSPMQFMPLASAGLGKRNARVQRERESCKRQREQQQEGEGEEEAAIELETAAELVQEEARKALKQERERLLQELRGARSEITAVIDTERPSRDGKSGALSMLRPVRGAARRGAVRMATVKQQEEPRMFTRKHAKEEARWEHGALLVDKPREWTSFDVCDKLRLRLKKAMCRRRFKVGHAGTLDPLATGLLVVCTGSATKWSDTFAHADKEYSGALRLGQWTPSADCETSIEATSGTSHITDQMIFQARNAHLGSLEQTPPKFSAVKVNGEKLCDIARRGDPVPEAAKRNVAIHSLTLSRSDEDSSVLLFHTRCSKGTYIRTLCEGIGEHLGTYAHMLELRREAVGELRIEDAWPVNELLEQLQLPQQSQQVSTQEESVR